MNFFIIFQHFLFFNIHTVRGSNPDEANTSNKYKTNIQSTEEAIESLFTDEVIMEKNIFETKFTINLSEEKRLIYNTFSYLKIYIQDIILNFENQIEARAQEKLYTLIYISMQNSFLRFVNILKDIVIRVEATQNTNSPSFSEKNMPKNIDFVSIIIQIMELIQILRTDNTFKINFQIGKNIENIIKRLQGCFFNMILFIENEDEYQINKYRGEISSLEGKLSGLNFYGLCRKPKYNIVQGIREHKKNDVTIGARKKLFDIDYNLIEKQLKFIIQKSNSLQEEGKPNTYYNRSKKICDFFVLLFQCCKEIITCAETLVTLELNIDDLGDLFYHFNFELFDEKQKAVYNEFICFQLEKHFFHDLCSINDYLNKGIQSASNDKFTMRSNIIKVYKKIDSLLLNIKEKTFNILTIRDLASSPYENLIKNNRITFLKDFKINEINEIIKERNDFNKTYKKMCIIRDNLTKKILNIILKTINKDLSKGHKINKLKNAIVNDEANKKNMRIYKLIDNNSIDISKQIEESITEIIMSDQLCFTARFPLLSMQIINIIENC